MTLDDHCSRNILEVSPRVIHFIRTEARNQSDLTVAQFRALARLSHSSATNSELAEIQGISAPTMCRIVEGLVRKGLIQRSKNKQGDQRQVQLFLTPQGRSDLDQVREKIRGSILTKLESLSQSEKTKLNEGLTILMRLFP